MQNDHIIENGTTLTFANYANVNMNAFLKVTSGFLFRTGVTYFTPDIRSYSGAYFMGQYPSLQSAFDHANIGETVKLLNNRSEDITVSRRVHLTGVGNVTLSGDVTVNNIASYLHKFSNLTVDGRLTVNSCDCFMLDDAGVEGTIDLNWSGVDLIDVSHNNDGQTDCYDTFLFTDGYDKSGGTISISAVNYSLLYLYMTTLSSNLGALNLHTGSEADLQDVVFCYNAYDDIYAAAGTYCNAEGVLEWSGYPPNFILGSGIVDYILAGWQQCSGLPKRVALSPELYINSNNPPEITGSDSDEGMQEYKTISEILKEKIKIFKQEIKDKNEPDKEKFSNDTKQQLKDLKKLVKDFHGKQSSQLALAKIATLYRLLDSPDELFMYLTEIENDDMVVDMLPFVLNHKIYCSLYNKDYLSALSFADRILNDYTGCGLDQDVLYAKGLIYLYYLRDSEKAAEIFNHIITLWPDTAIAELARSQIEHLGKKAPETEQPVVEIPDSYAVGNYPNPFNPATSIVFKMPEAGDISLNIFDISGRLVKNLANGVRPSGIYTVQWDSRNMNGRQVSSGVYYFRFQCNGFIKTGKMVLMR